jgi:hypothetical protein
MKKVFAIALAVALMLVLIPAAAVMAQASSMTVTPEIEQNVINTSHTITADVDPDDYYIVTFEVVDGPNTGLVDDVSSDEYGVAEWEYTSTVSGIDEIEVTVDSVTTTVYKVWLTDKFSGGGQILQDTGGKKKDFYKISWGGWAGTLDDGGPFTIGAFEVTFHNVSNDDLDKAKFVSADEWMGITELYLEYYDMTSYFPPAYPPESLYNEADVYVGGELFDEDGNPIVGDWMVGIYAIDSGEPGVDDAIAFDLWDGETLVYASNFDDFEPLEWYSPLDSGNLQVVVPPVDG